MTRLYDFQRAGAAWMAPRRFAMLGDEMGLGKTPQIVRAADLCGAKSITIICPAIVRSAWARAFEPEDGTPGRFAWVRRPVHVMERLSDRCPREGVAIYSFDGAAADEVAISIAGRAPDVMGIDEAHYLKDPRASRSKRILGNFGSARFAGAVWMASGTFAPNDAGELYPALAFGGQFVGSRALFRQLYTVENDAGRVVDTRNADDLRERLGRVMLRRVLEDVEHEVRLPPLHVDEIHMDGAELQPGDGLLAELAAAEPAAADAIRYAAETGDWSMATTPHVATVCRLIGLAKVRATAALATDMARTGKLLLVCTHLQVIDALCRQLEALRPVRLVGSMTPAAKREAVQTFQHDRTAAVAVWQISTAGTGVTATAATRVLLVEPAWSPAVNLQAIKRIHRIGQTSPCEAYYVSLRGSIDAHRSRVLMRKQRGLRKIMSPGLQLAPHRDNSDLP